MLRNKRLSRGLRNDSRQGYTDSPPIDSPRSPRTGSRTSDTSNRLESTPDDRQGSAASGNLLPVLEVNSPGDKSNEIRKSLDERFANCNINNESNNCEQTIDNDSPTVSLSSLPNDLVEQANLDRDRELRKEKIKPTMSLPLDEQGVTEEEICTTPREEYAPGGIAENGNQPPWLKVGDLVRLSENLEGQVRFYGRTKFADGIWVGIALSIPEGTCIHQLMMILYVVGS